MVGSWHDLSAVASVAKKRFSALASDLFTDVPKQGSGKVAPVSDPCRNSVSNSSNSPLADRSAALRNTDRSLASGSRYDVDHRALLFGSRFGKVGSVNGKGRAAAKIYSASEKAMLEAQNEELLTELEEKVEALTVVSLDIGREASESNGAVSELGHDLDSAHRSLQRVVGRVRDVAEQTGGSRLWLVVVLILIALACLHTIKPAAVDDRRFLSAAPTLEGEALAVAD